MHIHLSQITYSMHAKGDFQPSLGYIQHNQFIHKRHSQRIHSHMTFLDSLKNGWGSEAFWEEEEEGCDMLTQGHSMISA